MKGGGGGPTLFQKKFLSTMNERDMHDKYFHSHLFTVSDMKFWLFMNTICLKHEHLFGSDNSTQLYMALQYAKAQSDLNSTSPCSL
jgi:hypothetical protein